MTAVAAFETASILGKVMAAVTVLDAAAQIGTVIQGMYTDGKTYLGANLPAVEQLVENILDLVEGKALPAPVVAAVPVAPAA